MAGDKVLEPFGTSHTDSFPGFYFRIWRGKEFDRSLPKSTALKGQAKGLTKEKEKWNKSQDERQWDSCQNISKVHCCSYLCVKY